MTNEEKKAYIAEEFTVFGIVPDVIERHMSSGVFNSRYAHRMPLPDGTSVMVLAVSTKDDEDYVYVAL